MRKHSLPFLQMLDNNIGNGAKMDVVRNSITNKQLKIIYSVGLRAKKLSKEKLHSILEKHFGKKHFRELSKNEAFQFINFILNYRQKTLEKGTAFLRKHGVKNIPITPAQKYLIHKTYEEILKCNVNYKL